MSLSNQSTSQIFPFAPGQVFQAFVQATEKCGMKLQSADETIGRITAKVGMSLFSWGEQVSIRVEDAGNGSSRVVLESALKFGANISGAHRHAKNFEALIAKASDILKA